MATTTRPNLPLPLLLLWTLLALLAHGSPLATPSSPVASPRPLQPAPRALSPTAQATPTTGPRMPYPIPDTYNGTAFGRLPHGTGTGTGTGGAARPTGTGRWRIPPAQVTAAPGGGGRNGTVAAAQKDIPFIQTTYWSCVQWPTTVHCGWHKPILAVGDAAVAAAAPGGPTGGGAAARAARRACAVVGAGLLAGFGLGFM